MTPQEAAKAACAAGEAAAGAGDLAGAADHFRQATELDPQNAIAHRDLGTVLFLQNRFLAAEVAYRKALRLNPNFRTAQTNLAAILTFTGRGEAALRRLRQLVAVDSNSPIAFSRYLYALTHSSGHSPSEVFAEHVRFGGDLAAGLPRPAPHANSADPERRLKVGYVSADVGGHILGLMLEPALRAHDRSGFEVFIYDNAPAATRRTVPPDSVDSWVQVADLDDEALAARVRADGIDILVDLSGHTSGNRLAGFARKPAPVQVSWLGYPFTTGVSAIDYRICDARQIGPGTADLLVEEAFVVPGASVAFLPPETPACAPPASLAAGHVTFGSMNSLDKIDDAVLAVWAQILRAVPTSRFLMKARGLQDPPLQAHFARQFEGLGVAGDRIAFEGGSALEDFLGSFSRIDIALDPFPYTGGSTSRYTLWMGVPLVTLEGVALYERFSSAILRELGLDDCVAADTAGYVAAAVALAGDPTRLAELRRELRPRMRASPLCDITGQGRRLDAAYREMWRRWCVGC